MRVSAKSAVALLTFLIGLASSPARAADLVWEVQNPFRLYKQAKSFQIHEAAFKAVKGPDGAPISPDIVRRIEHCLNDPDASGAARSACGALARERSRNNSPRLGWAANTYDDACYDRSARPRRYPETCERKYAFSTAPVREDYVLPAAHTVSVALSPDFLQTAGDGECAWRWKPRTRGSWSEPQRKSCRDAFVIARVPYSRDRAASGAAVKVTLPDGRTLSEADIVVEDLLVVALGDSFSSGEGNPDRPVTFSAVRAMNYNPVGPEAVIASMDGRRRKRTPEPRFIVADDRQYDPNVLPRRLLEDEERGQGEQYALGSERFRRAFWNKSEVWLSPDCHRSQYAYPVRVSMQLALEDRHRAVTLVHLSCSGAEVAKGLFLKSEAREHFDPTPNKTKLVDAQFDQLTRLICRGAPSVDGGPYTLPTFEPGDTRRSDQAVHVKWCAPSQRKRDIDLVLLSIGGNDVGFSALAAYSFLDSAGDIASVAKLREGRLRFGPRVAEAYLAVLDARIDAVKKALDGGFGVEPSKVIQTSYEPVQFDENQRICGSEPLSGGLGMDVHPKFRINPVRLQEVGEFVDKLSARLKCLTERTGSCPRGLRTGEGTRFTLVTEHQREFLRRGVCARDPSDGTGVMMRMPRLAGSGDFSPYTPDEYRPYASRTRLFRTPNDAFLTANTHAGGQVPLFDILQPAIASLYSGAFHPTAEAHAIVADHVMKQARRIVASER